SHFNLLYSFFFQAEDGIRDATVTGVQTCALPIFVPVGGHAPEPANLKRARFLHDLWVTGAAAAIVLIVNCHDVTIDEVDPSLLAGYRKHMRVGSGLVRKQQDSARTEVIVVDTKTGLVVGSEVVRERQ